MKVAELYAWVPEELDSKAINNIALQAADKFLHNMDSTIEDTPRKAWGSSPAGEGGALYRVVVSIAVEKLKDLGPNDKYPEDLDDQ